VVTQDKDKRVEALVRIKKKEELVHMCQVHGLPISGTKYDLGARLFGKGVPFVVTPPAVTAMKNETPSGMIPQKKKPGRRSLPRQKKGVFQKPRAVVVLQKLDAYHDVHEKTGLVWERETQRVVGHVRNTTRGPVVDPLTREGIEMCKQFHFRYRLPVCLDAPLEPLTRTKIKSWTETVSDDDDDDVDDENDQDDE